jgi:hypothetical protein
MTNDFNMGAANLGANYFNNCFVLPSLRSSCCRLDLGERGTFFFRVELAVNIPFSTILLVFALSE